MRANVQASEVGEAVQIRQQSAAVDRSPSIRADGKDVQNAASVVV